MQKGAKECHSFDPNAIRVKRMALGVKHFLVGINNKNTKTKILNFFIMARRL